MTANITSAFLTCAAAHAQTTVCLRCTIGRSSPYTCSTTSLGAVTASSLSVVPLPHRSAVVPPEADRATTCRLDGTIGDLLLMPGSQNSILPVRGIGELFRTAGLPGSISIDSLPPGSAVVLNSGLLHARRCAPRAGSGSPCSMLVGSRLNVAPLISTRGAGRSLAVATAFAIL